jgi:serine/threonine protein kinase/tetratricopeptide (TPR) repeat protein
VANKCPTCRSDNRDALKFCGECGTQLPPLQSYPPNVTETLQMPVHELTTGSTFAGRYQVIEELGHGGMGRVYKVQDTEIKEKVALKLLRSEITLDKEAVERFSNELKLARKISHRNVCRMFDLGRAEGTTFITMEFVPGEDLKSFIHRSKQLNIGTAISLAKQVCEGLEEAHRLGVVHRDLKPGNIMIDKDGDAKIMDFGIARSLSGKGITGAGVLIGTPEYMSPEQVEGKDVDQRSDIYSLGVILYEMVAGRLPFMGETPLSVAHKHKYEVPEDPKKFNTQVSDDLARVILKCLAKDRNERFQSAVGLGTELGRIEQGLPTTDRIVRKRKALTSKVITVKFRLAKVLAPVSVFIVLVLAGFILWRIVQPGKPALSPTPSGQPTLAVLYFENNSGDRKLDNWHDGLAVLLIADLRQSRYIRVVADDEMYTVLKRLGLADARKYSSEDIEKIAAQTRASYILRGNYFKAGESFVVTASLQKPGAGESPSALRIEAHDDKDIFAKVDELTRQVKEGLNLTSAQISSDIEKGAGKITTSSPEALKYYIEGRKLHTEQKYDQAVAYMEKAVEIDPEFAMAYAAMASAHYNLRHFAESQKYIQKAQELSARLPENERLLIEGRSFLFNGDYARAIEVYGKLVKMYPDLDVGHSSLAVAYFLAGDIDKAIEQQEIAVRIQRTPLAIQILSNFYGAEGLYQKMEDVCRSFLQDVEDNASVHNILFDSYVGRREFDLALAEAEKLYLLDPQKYQEPKGIVLFYKGDFAGAEKILVDYDWQMRLLLARGKINETIGLSQRSLEKSNGDKEKEAGAYGGLAGVLEKAGRYEEAYRVFNQYLKLSAENRKAAGESGMPYLPSARKGDLFSKGVFQAETKSYDEARKTAEELKSLIETGIDKRELLYYEYILGLIELGNKNYRQAADLFGRACGRLDFQGDASFSDLLARALYESGDLDKAQKEYEKITLLTTGRLDRGDLYAKAFYMLGKIAEQQGNKVRAITNYRKFLYLWKDADPGLPEVEEARKRLAGLKAQ